MRCLKGISGQQIANGLKRSLDEYPEWPPGAAQFRALALNIETDSNGKKHVARAGIYNTAKTQSMLDRERLCLESDEAKGKRLKTAERALGGLSSMFADASASDSGKKITISDEKRAESLRKINQIKGGL